MPHTPFVHVASRRVSRGNGDRARAEISERKVRGDARPRKTREARYVKRTMKSVASRRGRTESFYVVATITVVDDDIADEDIGATLVLRR